MLAAIIGSIAALFFWLYMLRTKYDYNDQGRFFSPEEGVVYHEQTQEVYGMLALVGGLFTIVLLVLGMRIRKEARKNTE